MPKIYMVYDELRDKGIWWTDSVDEAFKVAEDYAEKYSNLKYTVYKVVGCTKR